MDEIMNSRSQSQEVFERVWARVMGSAAPQTAAQPQPEPAGAPRVRQAAKKPRKPSEKSIDAKIRKAFAEKIPGTTKIIIAQRVSSVEGADRILVLDNGRVNAFDTHDNLLKTNAIYQEIYESQIKGGGDFDQPA